MNLITVNALMKRDFTQRVGFLVSVAAKLDGEQFDRLARERMGLSQGTEPVS